MWNPISTLFKGVRTALVAVVAVPLVLVYATPDRLQRKHALPTPPLEVRVAGQPGAPVTLDAVTDRAPLDVAIVEEAERYRGVHLRWALYRDGELIAVREGEGLVRFTLDAPELVQPTQAVAGHVPPPARGASYSLFLTGTKRVRALGVKPLNVEVTTASVRIPVDFGPPPGGYAVPSFSDADAPAPAPTASAPATVAPGATPAAPAPSAAPSAGLTAALAD